MPKHWNYGIRARWATAESEDVMEIDKEKVDEITLALLYLTTFKDRHGLRAWKSHNWEVLDRLHESGHIYEPGTKARRRGAAQSGCLRSTLRNSAERASVALTELDFERKRLITAFGQLLYIAFIITEIEISFLRLRYDSAKTIIQAEARAGSSDSCSSALCPATRIVCHR